MTDTLTAYHNDPQLKDRIMAKIAAHREADEIIKGTYWAEGKGCAVGCVLEDPDGGHIRYEAEFGIPVQLAYLEDAIFEALPEDASIAWPERFMGAIKPGADLSRVWPEFAIWLMVDEKWGVVNTADDDRVKDICRRVADGYARLGTENALNDEDAEKLARDAWAAWAAWAARDAWAAWDARDARDARVARAAWDARIAWAAWDAFVVASADKLIELLGNPDVS